MDRRSLHDELVAALEPVALQLDEDGEVLTVRRAHVVACPAAAALDGDDGFEPSAATVAWELASAALDRLLHGSRDPGLGRPPTSPVPALALAAAETSDNWAFDWWATAGDAERSVATGEVQRRVAAVARMARAWPVPGHADVGARPRWSFPGRALRVNGRIDLAVTAPGGRSLVVVLAGNHGPVTRSQLAFEAVIDALLRKPADQIVGVLPDAGRRWPVPVDDALLGEGIAAIAGAARVALGARRRDGGGLARRSGTRCRTCVHAGGCEAGRAWLTGPGRLRSGFLPPARPAG